MQYFRKNKRILLAYETDYQFIAQEILKKTELNKRTLLE